MSLFNRIMGFGATVSGSDRTEPVMTANDVTAPDAVTTGTAHPAGWVDNLGWGGRSRVKTLPHVTPSSAQRHSTVFSCCNVIAGDLSKVPLRVYQENKDGREVPVVGHPASYLLNVESSPGVPSIVPRYMLAYAFALRGVAFAYAPRDGAGELELIATIPQNGVSILRNGRARFYDLMDGAEINRRVPGRSMVHMRYMAEDGWTGRSPIEVAFESMGLAMAGQEAAARSASGTTMRAFIQMEDLYEDEEAFKRAQKRVANSVRDPEVEGFPIMGANDKITPLDLKASDIELLASRRLDREQIAGMWRVPPTKLQILEYGVKANSEQAAIDYLTDCLYHWGSQVEDQMSLSILTEEERRAGLFLRHDYDALLRATTKERYEALAKAIGGPFVTPNEGRFREGLPPVEGGNVLNPAPNMTRKEGGGTEPKGDDE